MGTIDSWRRRSRLVELALDDLIGALPAEIPTERLSGRDGAAQPHEDNAENGRRKETAAHGEVIAIRVCSGNRLHPR
jgi:hypothetical protein